MPSYVLLLLLASLVWSQYTCPPQGGAYAVCGTTVLYIIDTSTDLDSTSIANEFTWIRNSIIPGTAWGTSQKLALTSYGTGNIFSFIPTDLRTKACGQLNSLQGSYDQLKSNDVTLFQTMNAVELMYGGKVDNMVLFTASKNLTDIAQTADYILSNMQNETISVIALAGSNFTGFPARVIYDVESLTQPPPNLPSCIIKNACDQDSSCNIYGTTDEPVYFPTTDAPTTMVPSTRPPTSPSTTTRTASPPVTTGLQCQCNTSTVWIDVMFLLDASAGAGRQGLEEIWTLVGTSLGVFNVQKTGFTGTNYYTRAGIITYAANATLYKSLGSVDNDDIYNILPHDLPYDGEDATNLEAAIQAATNEFTGANHRPNAKKVIVIVATTYNPSGLNGPQQVANTFKDDGGLILVYDYVPEHGSPSTIPGDIASPGYYLTNQNVSDSNLELNQALCDTNCFCSTNYESFTDNYRKNPTNGCYQPVIINANYRLADSKCSDYNGWLSTDQNQDKSVFLWNLIHQRPFWLGLNYTNNQWVWQINGSPVGTYQPWAGGVAPVGECVFMNSNLQWVGTACRNGYQYICEASPCDSMHYCG